MRTKKHGRKKRGHEEESATFALTSAKVLSFPASVKL